MATEEFTGDITRDYYENLDVERMSLLDLITKIEMSERERKSRERGSLFGGIGKLLGLGASFIPGLSGLRGLIGGGDEDYYSSGMNVPFTYEPWKGK